MVIRQALPSDARTLSALAQKTYADAFGDSMSASDLAAHLEKNLSIAKIEQLLEQDTLLVAEIDGRMVGFVQFGKCDPSTKLGTSFEQADSETDQELRRLYVLREFQNRKIGAQLMNAALNHPRMKNAPRIFLDVWEHNHGAQHFYQRYGFRVIGERKFEVESGAETSADLIMVRSSAESYSRAAS